MSLKNYRLRPPSTVILDDDRDPQVSWQNHLARTSGLRPGVDLVAPIGTPVYARTSGVLLHIPNDGSAGNSSRFHHDDNPGWKDVFSHLSSYVGESGDHFEAGEVVAYTGISGGVAPHLHWHLLDPSNVRRNPWDYFSGASVAGINQKPVAEEEDIMQQAYVIVKRDDAPQFVVVGAGSKVAHIRNEAALRGAKKIIRAFRVDSDDVQEVTLSGEEWDAGTLDCFGG